LFFDEEDSQRQEKDKGTEHQTQASEAAKA